MTVHHFSDKKTKTVSVQNQMWQCLQKNRQILQDAY